ncbi:MAG: biotin--[acetyl-CoA-carboxylase] ligase [Anaerolineae bacterium]|nr:biotin--[acetyl-CoA-carboxylase] ligase [Anaerolineae bacterium]
MSDRFSTQSLGAVLGDRPFCFSESTGSTQDIAREWALAEPDLPPGAVVITEEQTGGRGRQGRVWFSPPGACLLFSVIQRPAIAPQRLPRLTMAGGLAVIETLAPLVGERARLKWPNDVLIDGRKVCGILSEATWIGDRLAVVIIGIGINIRVDFSGMDLDGIATSLEPELGRTVDRHTLLTDMLRRVDAWAARANDPAILDAWRDHLGTLGKRVTVYLEPHQDSGASFAGVAETVDDDGALLVRTDSGDVRRVLAADVGLAEG